MGRSISKLSSSRKSDLNEAFQKSRVIVWVLVVQMIVVLFEMIVSVQHILENGPVVGTSLFMQSAVLVDWPLILLLSVVELMFFSTLVYFVWTTLAWWAVFITGIVIVLGCVTGVVQMGAESGGLQLQSLIAFISIFPMFVGGLAAMRYHSLKKSGVTDNPVEVFD